MARKYGWPLQRIGLCNSRFTVSTILAFSGLVLANHASAAIVENATIGNPKALALGNAVTADPPGIDSIHFNPAGLARVQGREALLKVTAASFNFRIEFGEFSPQAQQQLDVWGKSDPVENTVSETDTAMLRVPFREALIEWPLQFLIVPTGGAAYKPEGSDFTFGTAAYSPMAAGYKREKDDPGRFMGEELSLVRITYFSPTVGIQLNDEWSAGVGLHFSWQGAAAKTELRVPHLALAVLGEAITQIDDQLNCDLTVCDGALEPFQRVADLEFNADAPLSTSVNFGLLWEPAPWFTWGVVYQSEAKSNMTGYYKFTYGDEWVSLFTGVTELLGVNTMKLLGLPTGRRLEEGEAKVEFKVPQHFATGISVQVTPRWKFNADAKWTDWGIWDGLVVEFDQPMDFLQYRAAGGLGTSHLLHPGRQAGCAAAGR